MRKETLPTGDVVIVTPGLTIQSIYLYFYMAINLGSTGAISASFLARDNGFWVAYLVPTCIFATMPILLFSFRKFYVITPPRGSILLETFRVIGLCLAARWSPLTAWRNIRSKGFWDTAKSSSYKTGEIPAKITWDDELIWDVELILRQILDYSLLNARVRPVILKALLKLSTKCGQHPRCFTLSGRLQLLGHQVAAGSFGDVWKGLIHDEAVSVKILRVYQEADVEALLKEFSHEALIWRQLSDANILPFFGVYYLGDTKS